jgi:nucleoside-diphosphate-sugar epimerase
VTVNEMIRLLERITGRKARIQHRPQPPGEARHTFADTGAARRDLGFAPRHGLEEGLAAEAEWILGEVVPPV